jgi:ABC-type lipoprotein release transport system permease subunit
VLFGRGVEALLFDVRPTDPAALAAPAALFALTALLAAIPPAVRAVGIDPAMTLRSE